MVKPNCSIQSYVPIIRILEKYGPKRLIVTALQAISGASKTFQTFPDILDNVIPFIKNEEEKSEKEPMKILGKIVNDKIDLSTDPNISATCIRVAASEGHMTSVDIELENNIDKNEFINAINNFKNPIAELNLPSAPKEFIKYFDEKDRPQTKLDRDFEKGMGITIGRLRKNNFGWKFVSLSHNTIRGAAGGAILTAELLKVKGYI